MIYQLHSQNRGFKYSLLLHALVLAFFCINFVGYKDLSTSERIVVVDLVSISEATNLRNDKTGDNKSKIEKSIVPEKVKSEPILPTKTKVADTKPSAIPVPDKSAVKKKETPVEKPVTKKNLSKMLSNLEKQFEEKEVKKQNSAGVNKSSSDKFYDANSPLTITQRDNIKGQIEKRFINPLALDFKPNQLVVKLKLEMNQDGTIKNIEALNSSVYSAQHKNAFVALKDNLMRAAYMASPLKNLPADKFEGRGGWKEIELTFDAYYLMNVG